MMLDQGVCDAIRYYVKHGLDPGSFGRACLTQDFAEAWMTAHSMLRQEQEDGLTVVHNMLTWVSVRVPSYARGDPQAVKVWMDHRGLDGAPDAVKVQYQLDHFEDYLALRTALV